MQANGELEKMNNKLVAKAKYKANRPTPVAGITRATETKVWEFDPTYIATKDISTSYGVIVKKGDRVNPLDKIPLSKIIIFYDGDDKKQIAWVKNKCRKFNDRCKLVLVNGAISDQTIIFNKPVYFDQFGSLTTKFNIKHAPAVIKQKGNVLEITEVKI